MAKFLFIPFLFFIIQHCCAQDNVRVDNTIPKYRGGPMDSAHIRKAKKLAQKRLAKFYTNKRYQYLFRRRYGRPLGRRSGV